MTWLFYLGMVIAFTLGFLAGVTIAARHFRTPALKKASQAELDNIASKILEMPLLLTDKNARDYLPVNEANFLQGLIHDALRNLDNRRINDLHSEPFRP